MPETLTAILALCAAAVVLCVGLGVLAGVLLAVAYLIRAIRGIRLLCAREDRTMDTVARFRERGQV